MFIKGYDPKYYVEKDHEYDKKGIVLSFFEIKFNIFERWNKEKNVQKSQFQKKLSKNHNRRKYSLEFC